MKKIKTVKLQEVETFKYELTIDEQILTNKFLEYYRPLLDQALIDNDWNSQEDSSVLGAADEVVSENPEPLYTHLDYNSSADYSGESVADQKKQDDETFRLVALMQLMEAALFNDFREREDDLLKDLI